MPLSSSNSELMQITVLNSFQGREFSFLLRSVTISVSPDVPIVCYADFGAPVVIHSDTTPCPERDWGEDSKLEMCSGC